MQPDLSKPVEPQMKRTIYPAVAGALIIVSACLLIVSHIILHLDTSLSYYDFLSLLPNLVAIIILSVIALIGGVQALNKKRFLFAFFGSSFLITQSLLNITYVLNWLVSKLFPEEIMMSGFPALFIAISPIALALSILSLILLARSRNEFR